MVDSQGEYSMKHRLWIALWKKLVSQNALRHKQAMVTRAQKNTTRGNTRIADEWREIMRGKA